MSYIPHWHRTVSRPTHSLTAAHSLAVSDADSQLQWRTVRIPMHHFLCSLAVLDPRVGHTMDVLSPSISIICHSD